MACPDITAWTRTGCSWRRRTSGPHDDGRSEPLAWQPAFPRHRGTTGVWRRARCATWPAATPPWGPGPVPRTLAWPGRWRAPAPTGRGVRAFQRRTGCGVRRMRRGARSPWWTSHVLHEARFSGELPGGSLSFLGSRCGARCQALRMNVPHVLSGAGWGQPSRAASGRGTPLPRRIDFRLSGSTRARELMSHLGAFEARPCGSECRVRDVPRASCGDPCEPPRVVRACAPPRRKPP